MTMDAMSPDKVANFLSDLAGHGANDSPHVHLERLDPATGEVLENWHLRW
jgi:hypothetical protein